MVNSMTFARKLLSIAVRQIILPCARICFLSAPFYGSSHKYKQEGLWVNRETVVKPLPDAYVFLVALLLMFGLLVNLQHLWSSVPAACRGGVRPAAHVTLFFFFQIRHFCPSERSSQWILYHISMDMSSSIIECF
jgi:hypothetical protein